MIGFRRYLPRSTRRAPKKNNSIIPIRSPIALVQLIESLDNVFVNWQQLPAAARNAIKRGKWAAFVEVIRQGHHIIVRPKRGLR